MEQLLPQLLKKRNASYGTQFFITIFTTTRYLPLSKARRPSFCIFKLHLTIIVSSTRSPKWHVSLRFSLPKSRMHLSAPLYCHMPRPSLLDMITRMTFLEDCKSCILMKQLSPSLLSFPLALAVVTSSGNYSRRFSVCSQAWFHTRVKQQTKLQFCISNVILMFWDSKRGKSRVSCSYKHGR